MDLIYHIQISIMDTDYMSIVDGLQAFYSMSNIVGVTWFSGLLWASQLRQKQIIEIRHEQSAKNVKSTIIFNTTKAAHF